RAAEEDRCLPRAAIGIGIEAGPRARDDVDRVDELLLAAAADQLGDLRRLRAGDDDGSGPAAARLPLVEQHRVLFEVEDALEIMAVSERPVHRRRGNAEHALDLIEQ